MALKQWHRTAEMVTSYTKMGWTVTVTEKSANTDSDMASSSICKMTVFKIQMRDIRNPTKRTSLRTLTTTFLSSFRIQKKAEKSNQVILFYLQYLFSTYHWFGCFYYFLFNFFKIKYWNYSVHVFIPWSYHPVHVCLLVYKT